jgi:hypothetical protein
MKQNKQTNKQASKQSSIVCTLMLMRVNLMAASPASGNY